MAALLARGPQGLAALPRARAAAVPCLKAVSCAPRSGRAIQPQQQGQQQGHVAPGRSGAAARAAGSAAALPLQPPTPPGRLQHLCRSVLVGLGAAALWSIAASAFTGAPGPFASLSLSASGGSSMGELPGAAGGRGARPARPLTPPPAAAAARAAGPRAHARRAPRPRPPYAPRSRGACRAERLGGPRRGLPAHAVRAGPPGGARGGGAGCANRRKMGRAAPQQRGRSLRATPRAAAPPTAAAPRSRSATPSTFPRPRH
jgi:hypothetical protein